MTPTQADIERFDRLYAIGCVVSRTIDVNRWEPADIHHLVEGRKRLGHHATIPLSPWFHRGVPPMDLRPSDATKYLGPSMAVSKRAFVERFGTERQLWELTNELIEIPPHDTERMAAAIESWRSRCGLQHVAADAGRRGYVRHKDANHHRQVHEADSFPSDDWSAVWQETDASPFQD